MHEAFRGFLVATGNMPLPRPGVYLIRRIANGKCYVGISRNVAARGHDHARGKGKAAIRDAIRRFGAEAFEFIPLFYSLDGTEYLPAVETLLIAAYDAVVPHGYNIKKADGGVGPYGEEFSKVMRAVLARPEVRTKRSEAIKAAYADPELLARFRVAKQKSNNKPEYRALMSVRSKASQNRPEVRARTAATIKVTNAKPETKARRSAASVASRNLPGVREAIAAGVTEHWSTNRSERLAILAEAMATPGLIQRRNTAIKEAWKDPALRAAKRADTARRIWITDGKVSRRIPKEDPIPNGWHRGKTFSWRAGSDPRRQK